MSFHGAFTARDRAIAAAASNRRTGDGVIVAVATNDRNQPQGAIAAVATQGESRDGTPITRIDTIYGERVTGPGVRQSIGYNVATFIETPIRYVDPRDGRRQNVPGSVRMVNYHAGNFSYDDHNLGPVRQVHPRLALEDARRGNEWGRSTRDDRPSRPAPARRSRSRDYHTVRTSHTTRETRTSTSTPKSKTKAPLVPIPAKLRNKGPPLWDDSAHDAWSCVNWEDFAMEAVEKERETFRDRQERPWGHEAWTSEISVN